MNKRKHIAKKLGLDTHGHLVVPFLVLLVLFLLSTLLFVAKNQQLVPESQPVTEASSEPSCQLTLTVPRSACNEGCQVDADCETGYCYNHACRLRKAPSNIHCNIVTTPQPTCSPKPVCIRAPCEFPEPPGGWCSSPTIRPEPTCGYIVDCAAPPEGCHYEGLSQCSCGKLVCENQPTPTCQPQPACLESEPRCLIPEPEKGWCPIQPSIVVATPTPNTTEPPEFINNWWQMLPLPTKLKNFLDMLYTTIVLFRRPSNLEHLLNPK